jgi:hypothetical protein
LNGLLIRPRLTIPLPRAPDQKALFDILELIQTYEILLDLINEFGTDVIDMHIAEGLAVTETLIAKVKNSAIAM